MKGKHTVSKKDLFPEDKGLNSENVFGYSVCENPTDPVLWAFMSKQMQMHILDVT